jgi:hypothetical protein
MIDMKVETLIERMSEENVNRLHSYCANYPNVGKYLMDELNTLSYWTHLTYENIANLNDALNCGWRPAEIGNLFHK